MSPRVRKAARNSWGENRLRETDWSSVRQCHGNGVSFGSSSRMCPGYSKKPVMSLLLHLFTSGHWILGGKRVYRRCYRRCALWFVFHLIRQSEFRVCGCCKCADVQSAGAWENEVSAYLSARSLNFKKCLLDMLHAGMESLPAYMTFMKTGRCL